MHMAATIYADAAPRRVRPGAAARPVTTLEHIRAHRYGVGGYASLFHQETTNGYVYLPGAFRAADVRHLRLNHAGLPGCGPVRPSLASVDMGTLYVETDAIGLWFEAALYEDTEGAGVMSDIRTRRIGGVSIGWELSSHDATTSGRLTVVRKLGIFEISILSAGVRPGCPGTWVDVNADARVRRRYGY
jgi:HK97 family phage prohead protease